MEFYEGPLDGLIARQLLAEDFACVCVRDGLVDEEAGGATGGGGLTDAVFVSEGLGYGEALVEGSEDGGLRDTSVIEEHGCVVCGHVQGPCVGFDLGS